MLHLSFLFPGVQLHAAVVAAGALAATVQLHPIMHWLAGNELAEGPSSPAGHNTLINRELLCWIIHFLKTIQQVIEESSKSCRSCHNCHFHREASGCCLRDAKRTAAPGICHMASPGKNNVAKKNKTPHAHFIDEGNIIRFTFTDTVVNVHNNMIFDLGTQKLCQIY